MRVPALVAVLLVLGCARPPTFPPPPAGVKRIAVEQPVNRTGEDLVVDGPGLLQRALRAEVSTVPDVLREDLRVALERQGFRVTEPGPGVPVLRTEIRRWQPYAADYDSVTVDVVASLVEPDGGRELWRAAQPDWVVSTSDASSRRDASFAASAAIADALLDGWQPSTATPAAR